ncbi:hypothetical protein PR202_ga01683 [Eleusine coracana subsp. coracana]|uniref:Thioredoxin domain-containing protein n=1 Tax=Eleusine coracana subsp. coracana TaxID=191504 RepID=A0AAV5BHH4_ELECO|nr:hypothetical protein PR202_ga00996 [Eleusine coracana subsp. coracana]GJM85876.1 hypothetical protein PR202_ga01683 [Eleusine coracana subsp. coracana]
MAISLLPTAFLAALLLLSSTRAEEEAVLTLDTGNFSEVVAKNQFIVVEFYAPWCGHCKQLAPEYEKAASILSKHDPPVVLAKVDASDKKNKDLSEKYDVQGFPTIKILRKQGDNVQEYNGPRVTDGIVEYLKKQAGPASVEIKSVEDAASLIGDKGVAIVGVFPAFDGSEFENFMAVAEKMRADYDFLHTLDAGILPRGDKTVKGPLIRLFKPFDELFVDSQEFDKDALQQFIEVSGFPTVVTFDTDPSNQKYLIKYFENAGVKAMLFLSFSDDRVEAFKGQIYEAAKQYGANNISFLIGDITDAQGAFQDGILAPYVKSDPVPEINDQPVKVVVANSLNDVVFNSGKNVLLEFYAPWCGHCQKLASILDEVAVSLQNDEDVIIAKMDATTNDIPSDFKVEGYPTIYFYSSGGNLLSYEGGRTVEAIIDFIKKNKGSKPGETTQEDDAAKTEASVHEETEPELVKDEL